MYRKIYTAEAVSKGHPDKFCDTISDMVLDACLDADSMARVACEVMATKGLIVIGGEITTQSKIPYMDIVETVLKQAGYKDYSPTELIVNVNTQSPDISQAVDGITEQGAGDQGVMIGYASNETEEMLPIEYAYAMRLIRCIELLLDDGELIGFGSDAKTQVSAEFDVGGAFIGFNKIVISIQHDENLSLEDIRTAMLDKVIAKVFKGFDLTQTEILINPSGRFVIGGIEADTGLTGRKIVADAYGPRIPVGGGAFSGKDPSKVDRSGAYYARYVAKNVVASGMANRCLVQVAYAIGKAEPLAVNIDTFGTGVFADDEVLKEHILKLFDFRPSHIIEQLDLKNTTYSLTATGGHFTNDRYRWERTDRASELLMSCLGD